MKIKRIILACFLVLLLVALIPTPHYYEDGGSIEYKAFFYSVTKVHSMDNLEGNNEFRDGIEIKILGIPVFYMPFQSDLSNSTANVQ